MKFKKKNKKITNKSRDYLQKFKRHWSMCSLNGYAGGNKLIGYKIEYNNPILWYTIFFFITF